MDVTVLRVLAPIISLYLSDIYRLNYCLIHSSFFFEGSRLKVREDTEIPLTTFAYGRKHGEPSVTVAYCGNGD